MQRSLWLLSAVSLAAVLAACSPNIQQVPQTAYVTVEFDPAASPPVVPSPTDLVKDPTTGLLKIPVSSANTPTETAFYQSYFDTLDGYPMETPASVTVSAAVNPATLATGVLVLDVTNPAAPAVVPVAATYSSSGADAGGVITIPPPGGMWTRAHTYAVTIIGGNQTGPFAAVTGANGEQVTASQTWALAASTSNCPTVSSCAPPVPLCALPDGGPGGINSGCVPTSDLIPAASAPQLQALQNAATPLLAGLAGAPFNIPRANVALLWSFTITSQAEVTFNPPTAIPFPNEILRTGPGGTVSLPPPPAGAPPLVAEILAGLNSLNGFSTTATIVSAVDLNIPNNGVSALMQGSIDPQSLTPQLAINLVKGPASFGAAASQGDPQWYACVSDVAPGCPYVTATLPDGGAKPEVLGIVPQTPLDELTTYVAYMTNAIRDTNQKPVIPSLIFALIRLPVDTAPLYANGKSQVPSLGVSDAEAQLLYELQAGQAPLFAQLASNGIPYTSVVQAWAFRTQVEVSQLQQLAAVPYNPAGGGFPGNPLWVENVTAAVLPALNLAGVPIANIGAIYVGEIVDPFLLTGPGNTFNPDGGFEAIPIPFVMTVPDAGPTSAAGYPVTMFGHGLTGNKEQTYAIASGLATAGQVMIAIDEVWHGARNTCTDFGAYADQTGKCTGSPICLPDGGYPDNAICTTAVPALTVCNAVGRCELADRTAVAACAYGTPTADQTCFNLGQNECAPDSKCEGADFNPAYSGWHFLNIANPFAVRDSFRQQTIDDTQFARVASGTGSGSLGAVAPLNPLAISYGGQSLGGLLGTLYTSVGFNVQNAALNVAGGDIIDIILTSPSFVPLLSGFQSFLAAVGIGPNTPSYDTVINIYRWILDPGDPDNMAYYTIHKTGHTSVAGTASIPATRRAFVQYIINDQVVPNPTTALLVQSALHNPAADPLKFLPNTGPLWSYQFSHLSTPFSFNDNDPTNAATYIPPCNRHGFLLRPPAGTCGGTAGAAGLTLTTQAQTQLVTFIFGAAPY